MIDNEPDSSIHKIPIYETKNDNYEEEIVINDQLRNNFFILLCAEYIISCCDGGIIPQQNKNIQKDFNDDGDSRVGLFCSIDFIGRILGAIAMSFLINKIDRKIYFSGCCFFKGFTLIVPLFTINYNINLISRFFSGIPQTLLTSYGTIWTDQFGKRKNRSMMLPILNFSTLLGVIVGYGIAIICDFFLQNSKFLAWRLSFFIEGFTLGVLGAIFLLYPKIYFSSTFYLNKDDDYKGKENLKHINDKVEQDNSFWKQLPEILCTKLFIFMSISNTVAFFGARVIQFYADKYMEVVLKIKQNIKYFLFIFLCLTGPSFGNIISGIICTKIGGYASKNGMKFILLLNIIACFSSIFITATLNPVLSIGACWIYLFCYSSAIPLQGGIIISSLPKRLKGNGFSLNMFFLNGIGSFPSSYIFSLIVDYIKEHYPQKKEMRYRTAMTITMLYNYFGLVLAIIAGIYRFRIKGDLDNFENEEKKIVKKKERIELSNIN